MRFCLAQTAAEWKKRIIFNVGAYFDGAQLMTWMTPTSSARDTSTWRVAMFQRLQNSRSDQLRHAHDSFLFNKFTAARNTQSVRQMTVL